MSQELVRNILNDCLEMKRVTTRLVLKDPHFLQKLHRMKIAYDMLEPVNCNPTFIKGIVTDDETWVYEFDMQIGLQA